MGVEDGEVGVPTHPRRTGGLCCRTTLRRITPWIGRVSRDGLKPMLHRHRIEATPSRNGSMLAVLVCAVLVVASARTAGADLSRWPEGSHVQTLAINPSHAEHALRRDMGAASSRAPTAAAAGARSTPA